MMHGLCNRALQHFLRDRLGEAAWQALAAAADAPKAGFEALLHYDDAVTQRLLEGAAARSGLSVPNVLEDLGTYLVAQRDGVRRLLRFCGPDFPTFLLALEELPDRMRLAVEDLDLPPLRLEAVDGGYRLTVGPGMPGLAAVAAGLIRAMADDYGTLALVTLEGEQVEVRLVEADFAQAREFDLAG